MLPQFEVLGTLVRDIHGMLVGFYYLALPVAILLAVVMGYLQAGGADYVDTIRRVFVATLLLIAFPDISQTILGVCDGIAHRIDDMSGLETVMRMAQEKSESYSTAKNVLLLKFNDLLIAILSFISFLILYISRYLTIAMYYFFWVLLSAVSPLMILAYVFPKTAYITGNLFKGLIEVAAWKIVWALLSAMLTALSFGNIYQTEGHYATLIVLNFVISLAMLMTPMIVKSIVGEGAQAMAGTLGAASVASFTAIPARVTTAAAKTKQLGSRVTAPVIQRYQIYQARKEEIRKQYRY
ncbi:MAG: hypothetical protein BroJett040_00680 [Oligoflexia bacterium]|nr:MAG: hypothetical protein BroJett040_00680 [Oligoflexia bacterium]